jgi:hypothetical protein
LIADTGFGHENALPAGLPASVSHIRNKGPKWLDGALHDAAMGAIRVTDGHFARKYRRIKARSGHKVAIGAVKHAILIATILIAIYHSCRRPAATCRASTDGSWERRGLICRKCR